MARVNQSLSATTILKVLGITILYFLSGRIGQLVAIPPGNITAVWPPSGIALASILLFGNEMGFGVFLGSLWATDIHLLPRLAIAIGATLQAGLAGWFMRKYIHDKQLFQHLPSVFLFVAITVCSCTIAPTLGVTSLAILGIVPWQNYGFTWLTFWIGDLTGAIILVPAILAWRYPFAKMPSRSQMIEIALWLGTLVLVAKITYVNRIPLTFILILLMVWAACKFAPHISNLALVILTTVVIVGTVKTGFFMGGSLDINGQLLLLQGTINSFALINLLITALITEQRMIRNSLEQKVQERTLALKLANEQILALNQNLQSENLRLGAEVEVTRKIQSMILPKIEELQNIDGLEVAGYMKPAAEVGGDYYDVLQDGDRVKIGIGDVTGHGLESGLLMMMVQTAVRTLLASQETNPHNFLATINRAIYGNVQRTNTNKNMSIILLDYFRGTIQLTGQHENVIVVRESGLVELIDTDELGFPIGLVANIDPFIDSKEICLNTGDIVVLYTDGITEASNSLNQLFEIERICTIVQENRHLGAVTICDKIITAVFDHIGNAPIYDDITCLVLKQCSFK